MERLGHLIQHSIEMASWKPIKHSCTGPNLSHLFFADDLILSAEASVEQINIVMDCLNLFCQASRQQVSLQKSSIFFSKNVDPTLVTNISSISGIPTTSNLGKYLGAPSIHGRTHQGLFQPILDKIGARLEGW